MFFQIRKLNKELTFWSYFEPKEHYPRSKTRFVLVFLFGGGGD